MNRISIFLLFLGLVSTTLFESCTKKTTSTPSNTPQLSATIAGSLFSGGTISSGDNGSSIIISSSIAGNKLSVSLSSFTSPGTYQVSLSGSYTIQYLKGSSTLYVANSGSIVVSSYANKVISGTFQGSAYNASNPSDVISITGGSFTAQL